MVMSLSSQAPDDFQSPAPTSGVSWHKYVRMLCTQAWDFDEPATEALLNQLDELGRAGRITDSMIVSVLIDGGVSETSALMIAPSIRVSILS